MPTNQIIFFMVIFALLLGWILKMIFQNQLREVYAVLWIVAVLCIPASIIFFPFLLKVSGQLGFIEPANFTLVVVLLVLIVLMLHFSALNSNLQRTLKNVVQKLAILEDEIIRLTDEKGGEKEEDQV
jgi:hypothetical protein